MASRFFTVRCGIMGFPRGGLKSKEKYLVSQKMINNLLTPHSRAQMYRFTHDEMRGKEFHKEYQKEFKKCLLIELSSWGKKVRGIQGIPSLKITDGVKIYPEDL